MIRVAKRLADRMLSKLVPATDAHACADVCVDVYCPRADVWLCCSPCRPCVCP